jgi:hypothetical protein
VKVFEQYRNFLLSIKVQTPVAAYEFAAASWHYDHEDHRCPMIVGSNRCSFTNRLQDLARKYETLKSMSDFLVRFTTVTWTSITTALVPTRSAAREQTPTSGTETGSLTKCRFHPISMCYMKFFSAAARVA